MPCCKCTNTMAILLPPLFICWQAQFYVHSHSFVFTFSRYSCVIIWISINYRGSVAASPACQLTLFHVQTVSRLERSSETFCRNSGKSYIVTDESIAGET